MVEHRQTERATHLALVFTQDEWDDDGNYVGSEPEGEAEVRYVSGGEGWVQTETGQTLYRNPTLDWPTEDSHLAEEGREIHLREMGTNAPTDPSAQYVIENVDPNYDRYRNLTKLDVEISSVDE